MPRKAGSELEEGEWTRIGDEWVVHHRVWRHSLYSPEFRFGDPAPEEVGRGRRTMLEFANGDCQ
eukprot:13633360-Alexandrium_andersonii.AAC.1